jgi:hypothetical protein
MSEIAPFPAFLNHRKRLGKAQKCRVPRLLHKNRRRPVLAKTRYFRRFYRIANPPRIEKVRFYPQNTLYFVCFRKIPIGVSQKKYRIGGIT